MNTNNLLRNYPIISDQIEPAELSALLRELKNIIESNTVGDIVEFGCYVGTTSLFIQRLIRGSQRTLHVYDSFAGLPEKSSKDASPAGFQFKTGELAATKSEFIKNFKKAGLKLPMIHKGWFSDLAAADIPDKIALAFLDGDYYESVMTPLKLIWPNLAPGAVVIVDDYQNEALPGAAKAVDEWLRDHKIGGLKIEASLAIIKTT